MLFECFCLPDKKVQRFDCSFMSKGWWKILNLILKSVEFDLILNIGDLIVLYFSWSYFSSENILGESVSVCQKHLEATFFFRWIS